MPPTWGTLWVGAANDDKAGFLESWEVMKNAIEWPVFRTAL